MHFVKSIKKRFHIEEVNIREDPEYASYAREALFLYVAKSLPRSHKKCLSMYS